MNRYMTEESKVASIAAECPVFKDSGAKTAADAVAGCIERNKRVLALDVEFAQRRIELLSYDGEAPDTVTAAAAEALTGDVQAVIDYLDVIRRENISAISPALIEYIESDVKLGVLQRQTYEYYKSLPR